LTIAIALCVGVLIGTPAWAQGEHARRAASELRVLLGDARRLQQADISAQHRTGLAERVRGGLAGLDLLLRLADQEARRQIGSYTAVIEEMRRAFGEGRLDFVADELVRLSSAFPLRAPGILPATPAPERLARGRALHERLCAGCHDQPDLTVPRPAYDLYEEARRLEPEELVARLLVGVRGDVTTGIDNPLSDEEIASLVATYTAGRE